MKWFKLENEIIIYEIAFGMVHGQWYKDPPILVPIIHH
jgi:hypothetical protein